MNILVYWVFIHGDLLLAEHWKTINLQPFLKTLGQWRTYCNCELLSIILSLHKVRKSELERELEVIEVVMNILKVVSVMLAVKVILISIPIFESWRWSDRHCSGPRRTTAKFSLKEFIFDFFIWASRVYC